MVVHVFVSFTWNVLVSVIKVLIKEVELYVYPELCVHALVASLENDGATAT